MMKRTRFSFVPGLAAFAAFFALSLTALSQVAPVHPTTPGHAATPKQEPCWQVAGISKSAIEQRKSIMQNAHSQVEAVCADSSLTAQQRNEKIRQIHQQAKQQVDALIAPAQMESLHSCQSSRASAHPPSGGHHVAGAGGGPCGTLPGSPGSQGTQGKPESEPEVEN